MSETGWRRIGRKAGPANVKTVHLAGTAVRIEVVHNAGNNTWLIRNYDNHSLLSPLEGFPSMAAARANVDERWPT